MSDPSAQPEASDVRAMLERIEQRLAALESSLGAHAAAVRAHEQSVNVWFGHANQLLDAFGKGSQATAERLAALQQLMQTSHVLLRDQISNQVTTQLSALAREDPENRRRLWAARAAPEYELPFTTPTPLISVIVPTGGRPDALRETVLPSILSQSHAQLEVIVVGYNVGPLTARAVASLRDERLSFVNLTQHVSSGTDLQRDDRIMPANEGVHRARGDWVIVFNDRHAMNANSLELLLRAAREHRAEVAYGRVRSVSRNADHPGSELVGEFPPKRGLFSNATALRHRSLSFFDLQLFAATTDAGVDGFLAEAMLHAGVRFTMIPDAIFDRAVST